MINSNVSYGRALMDKVGAMVPTFGRIFIVKNSGDSADPNYVALDEVFKTDTNGQVRVFTDLPTAYAATTSNNNDVICLDAHTSHKLSAMLTVANNRVHFIGMDGGGRLEDQRTLIFTSGTGGSLDTAMIKITGTGVTFRNIKFGDSFSVAQNVYCVDDQGANTMFKNCTIQALGSAHLTNNAAASLRLSSDTSLYDECTIGQDTLKVTSTGGQQVLISSAGTPATRVVFRNCQFQSYTSDTTHVFVRVAANGDIDRYIRFINPSFLNFNFDASNGGAQLAVAISTPANLVSGGLMIENPALLFATKLAVSTANAGVYVSNNVQPTAAGVAAVKATA